MYIELDSKRSISGHEKVVLDFRFEHWKCPNRDWGKEEKQSWYAFFSKPFNGPILIFWNLILYTFLCTKIKKFTMGNFFSLDAWLSPMCARQQNQHQEKDTSPIDVFLSYFPTNVVPQRRRLGHRLGGDLVLGKSHVVILFNKLW